MLRSEGQDKGWGNWSRAQGILTKCCGFLGMQERGRKADGE
jgi:hypothetical protein